MVKKPRLTDKDIEKIIGLLQERKPVPEIYKSKLFSSGDKEYHSQFKAKLNKYLQTLIPEEK